LKQVVPLVLRASPCHQISSHQASFKPIQAKMSKFILSSAGRSLGFKITSSRHVYPCESDSPLLFQERTVTIGPHKGCVEIFTEINDTVYYLDRHHRRHKPTGEVCFYKGVKGPAPKKNGRNINQFWIKTLIEGGFSLSSAAAPHQVVCFGEDGSLCLEDMKARAREEEEEAILAEAENNDLCFISHYFIPSPAAFVAEAPAPAVAPNPELVAPLDPIAQAEQQICEREERLRILTERLTTLQAAENNLIRRLSI